MFRPLLWAIFRSQFLYIRGKYIVCYKIYQSKIQRDLVFVQYSITNILLCFMTYPDLNLVMNSIRILNVNEMSLNFRLI